MQQLSVWASVPEEDIAKRIARKTAVFMGSEFTLQERVEEGAHLSLRWRNTAQKSNHRSFDSAARRSG
jgi:hypothetical protein